MKTNINPLFYLLFFIGLTLNSCQPSDQDVMPNLPPVTQMAEIGAAGGSITLQDSAGYSIELLIPDGALDDEVNITVTSTGEKIKNPIANMVFRGLRIEPENLLLKEPATIRITFPRSVKDVNKICVFTIMGSDYVIPIAEPVSGSHSIEGKIYFFKSYAAGTPTEQEILAQIAKAKEGTLSGNARVSFTQSPCAGNCPPTGFGWEGTETVVQGMLEWASQLSAIGNDDGAAKAIGAAEKIADQEIRDFLNMDIPDDPCGNYMKAAWKYFQLSNLLEISPGTADAIEKRALETRDSCAIRFTIEIDRETKSNGNEKEHVKAYGVVKCSIPFDDFSDAEAATSGQGVLSYNYTYEWLYNEAMNYKSTANGSGTIDVTCDGYTEVIDTPQGESQIWLRANIHFKNNITGQSCDTGDQENPCTDIENHAEWNERVDFLFQNGYTVGGQVDTKNGYVRDKMTLFIINMNQGGQDSDSGICY